METLTLRQRAKGRTLPAILISVIYILADVAFGYMIFPYIAFRRHNGSNIFALLVVVPLAALPFLLTLLYPLYAIRIDNDTGSVSRKGKELTRIARQDIRQLRAHSKYKYLDIYGHTGETLLRLEPLFVALKWGKAKADAVINHLRDRFGGTERQITTKPHLERHIDFPQQ